MLTTLTDPTPCGPAAMLPSSPELPVCPGQSTTGAIIPSPSTAGPRGAKHRRQPLDPGSDHARIERALNRIAAHPKEREVAHLICRCQGVASALRVVAAFRDNHPAQKQLTLWPTRPATH